MGAKIHRWIVDSIEELVASIEIDGRDMAHVPKWALPRNVKEGDVLAVQHEIGSDGEQSTLHIVIDREGMRLALEASARQTSKGDRNPNDPGGDIRF